MQRVVAHLEGAIKGETDDSNFGCAVTEEKHLDVMHFRSSGNAGR